MEKKPQFFDTDNSIHLLIDFSNRVLKRPSKEYIKECWNYECCYCAAKNNLTIDHVVPLSRGGTHDISNLVSACGNCNLNKGSNDMESWYRSKNYFCSDRLNRIQKWQKHFSEIS